MRTPKRGVGGARKNPPVPPWSRCEPPGVAVERGSQSGTAGREPRALSALGPADPRRATRRRWVATSRWSWSARGWGHLPDEDLGLHRRRSPQNRKGAGWRAHASLGADVDSGNTPQPPPIANGAALRASAKRDRPHAIGALDPGPTTPRAPRAPARRSAPSCDPLRLRTQGGRAFRAWTCRPEFHGRSGRGGSRFSVCCERRLAMSARAAAAPRPSSGDPSIFSEPIRGGAAPIPAVAHPRGTTTAASAAITRSF